MRDGLCKWLSLICLVTLVLMNLLAVNVQAQTVHSQSVCDDVIQPLSTVLKAFSTIEGSVKYKLKGPFGTTLASETIHWKLTFGPQLEVNSNCSNLTVVIGPSARVWSNLASVSGGMRLQAGVSINANQACLINWSFREFNIPGLSDLLNAVGNLVNADISTTDLANAILDYLQTTAFQPSSICVSIPGGGGGGGGGGTPSLQISNLDPNSGPPGTMVTVNGSGFRQGGIGLPIKPGSSVRFDGSSLGTTYMSSAQLQFTVPSDATCGPHNVQVNNPILLKGSGALSNIVAFNVMSPCSGGGGPGPGPSNQPPHADFSFTPADPTVGQMVQFSDQSTDPDGASDIVSWSWDLGDGMTSTTQNHTHTYNTAATFTVRLIVTDSMGQQGTAIKGITVDMGGQPTPSPPSGGGGTSLKSFDTNNNNMIDDAEFFDIIDAWIAGQIDDATFFQAVDLWISQGPISSAGLSSRSFSLDAVTLTANLARNTATFVAHGQGIVSVRVEVFNMSGVRILSQEEAGTRLVWSLSTSNGLHIANGVYLYVVAVRNSQGEERTSEVKKLVVLR